MNISKEQIDSLNAVLKIKLTPDDYQPQVDAELKKYQKSAKIPGFRPGKVPAGMIKKMYGRSILADGLNKIINDQLNKYITENKLDVLGNPLPKAENHTEGDFENPSDFEFLFELGLAPEFDVKLSASEKFDIYAVEVDEEMLEKEIANIGRRYGKFSNPDTAEAGDILYGEFVELNADGTEKEGGIKTSSTVAIELVKDEAEKAKFIGIQKESTITFNPMKALQNATEVGAMLSIKKEEAEALATNFNYTIKTVNRIAKAELNQELFDKILGPGKASSEGEFKILLKETIGSYYNFDAERKLNQEIVDRLMDKINPQLPNDFLKRWLMAANEKPITIEQVNQEYDAYARGLKWRLIENKLLKENNIEVSGDEVKDYARELMRGQFAQYGQMNMDDKTLDSMVDRYLANEESIRKAYENLAAKKVFELMRSTFTLNKKTVKLEEFTKIVGEN